MTLLAAGVLGLGACQADKPQSTPSSPNAVALVCSKGNEALDDLRSLGGDSSTTLDQKAAERLDTTLGSLKALSEAAQGTEMAASADSARQALSQIAALARNDPQGTKPETRDKAKSLQQQFAVSTQKFAEDLKSLCNGK